MAKTLNSALSTIYDRFVFTGSERSEFYYTNGIGGDDTQVTALQLTTIKNVDNETVITTDASQDVTLANDLKLSDGAIFKFGADAEVTLTHVHNTGLLLSDDSGIGTTQLQFGDSGTYVYQKADGHLGLVADTEIDLTATTVEVNGILDLVSTTDSSDATGDTGVLRCEGGASIAKKLYVGTNLAVTGTTTVTSTTALNDHVTIAVNKQLKFGDGNQHIATNNTDLTITTDQDLILDAVQVGIGTSTPGNLLEVKSATGSNAYMRINTTDSDNSTSDAGILLAEAGTNKWNLFNDGNDSDKFKINDKDGDTWVTIVQDTGYTGIGATDPSTQLEVRGPTGSGFTCAGHLRLSTKEASIRLATNDVIGMISFQAPAEGSGTDAILPGAAIWAEAEATDFLSNANHTALVFSTANSETAIATAQERMRINNAGKVGIGMSPNTMFNVKGAAGSGIRLYKSDGATLIAQIEGDASEDAYFTLRDSGGTIKAEIKAEANANSYIAAGGNFGVGTATPNQLLSLANGHILQSGGGDTTEGPKAIRIYNNFSVSSSGTDVANAHVIDTRAGVYEGRLYFLHIVERNSSNNNVRYYTMFFATSRGDGATTVQDTEVVASEEIVDATDPTLAENGTNIELTVRSTGSGQSRVTITGVILGGD